MSFKKTQLVLDTLAAHGDKGCGVITLSIETGVSQSTLRKFLKTNKDFCTQIGSGSKYKLNKFGPEKGNVEAMLHAIRKCEKKQMYMVYAGLLFHFIIMMLFY